MKERNPNRFRLRFVCRLVALLTLFPVGPAGADVSPSEDGPKGNAAAEPAAPTAPDLTHLDAYEAVRTANEKLRSGDADKALELYDVAEKMAPDAREIALGRGLSHYAKQEFDLARTEFLRAAAAADDSLAADALYAAAASDHAEALATQSDPKLSISKLEDAMRGYRNVLGGHPDHRPAQEADRKAATAWRQLKQQMQQQQQSGSNDQSNQNDQDQNQGQSDDKQAESKEKKDGKQQESSQQPGEQEKQESQADSSDASQQQKQQSKADQKPQEDSENAEQSESKTAEQDSKTKEPQSAQPKDSQKPDDTAQSATPAEEKEEASKEQAERRLREMMQSVRERRKNHREPVRPVQVAPVDKDW